MHLLYVFLLANGKILFRLLHANVIVFIVPNPFKNAVKFLKLYELHMCSSFHFNYKIKDCTLDVGGGSLIVHPA